MVAHVPYLYGGATCNGSKLDSPSLLVFGEQSSDSYILSVAYLTRSDRTISEL